MITPSIKCKSGWKMRYKIAKGQKFKSKKNKFKFPIIDYLYRSVK